VSELTSNTSVAFLRALAVDDALIDQLSSLPFSQTGTRRICLHESEASPLHAMLVESKSDVSFPPHFHSDSDEVSVAIVGQLELLVWNEGADKKPERIVLGRGPGNSQVSIVPVGVTHLTKAISENCVYLEVKLGPFEKNALVPVDSEGLAGL
jgi:cupin fold WbuC family metalloprotein